MSDKSKKERLESHWCFEEKHSKCGGVVSTLKKASNDIKKSFKEENFKYSSCHCYCHSQKLN